MNKFIVVIFPDEAKASEGIRALRELHTEGSLTLHALAVVSKSADEKISLKVRPPTEPRGLAVGALVGVLIGVWGWGAPMGAIVGAASGGFIGILRDLLRVGVSETFVYEVADQLTPGKTAIIAEIDEDRVTPLDTRMEAIGGVVVREQRSEDVDNLLIREAAKYQAELMQLKAERAQAEEGRKAGLDARIAETEAKLRSVGERAQAKLVALENERNAKIETLQDQATEATKDSSRAEIKRRIAAVRTDADRRSALLKKAAERVRKALT